MLRDLLCDLLREIYGGHEGVLYLKSWKTRRGESHGLRCGVYQVETVAQEQQCNRRGQSDGTRAIALFLVS